NSRLDPFLWMHALQDGDAGQHVKEGGEQDVISSTGERFSYRYVISSDNKAHRQPVFEYENHSQQGKFRLHSLAWVGFGNSQGSRPASGSRRKPAEFDTVSFTGFGIWSKDGVEVLLQASAQISTSRARPFVGIQIDNGAVSNVNTKPPNIKDAMP
ncbi:MAG: hypothetical protein LC754_08525, partial [Acidobacteria bacterium]|nr:hypothetical protein [Acidobacteriota bacterium]